MADTLCANLADALRSVIATPYALTKAWLRMLVYVPISKRSRGCGTSNCDLLWTS